MIFNETHDSKIKIKEWLTVKGSSKTLSVLSIVILLPFIKVQYYSYSMTVKYKSQTEVFPIVFSHITLRKVNHLLFEQNLPPLFPTDALVHVAY